MGDAPPDLIRTEQRARLPRGLSHPVGAEAVSHALAGCEWYTELWTAFGAKPLPLHPAPAGCEDFRLAFEVAFNLPDKLSNGRFLRVPAVPSGERAVVRRLLTAVGLPAAREWLRPRPETWSTGFRTFQVGYALDPPRACLVDALEHRVVGASVVDVPAEEG